MTRKVLHERVMNGKQQLKRIEGKRKNRKAKVKKRLIFVREIGQVL